MIAYHIDISTPTFKILKTSKRIKRCILKSLIAQKTKRTHHHENKAFALPPGTAERTQVWAPLCWSAVTPLWSCAALPQTVCSEGVLYTNSP